MKTTVRQATFDDLKEIIDMGGQMAGTSNFSHLTFDPRLFGEFVVDLIANDAQRVFVADAGDGTLAGALLGLASRSFIGPDTVVSDASFFVRPDMRASRAGVQLLRAFVDWAQEIGARRVNMGNSAGMDDDRYVKLLSRYGFTRAGSIMYRNEG